MKKLLGIAAGAGMLLVVAVPALAHYRSSSVLNANVNVASINNETAALSSTGGNSQGNVITVTKAGADDVEIEGGSTNTMYTGNADAKAGTVIVANTTVGCSTCNQSAKYNVNADFAGVNNETYADAYTGQNGQGDGIAVEKAHVDDVEIENGGSNYLKTGTATTRAGTITVVNTHWNK